MIRLMIKNWTREDKIILCTVLEEAYASVVNYHKRAGSVISKALANCLSWLEDDIAKTE